MGSETTRTVREIKQPTIEPVGTGQPTGASTSTTGTRERGTGTGTGTNPGTGTSTEEKKSVGLVDVKTDEQKRAEKNARRRELYAQKREQAGKTVKPKKVNKKAEPTPTVGTSDQIGAILGTVSMIVASRPGMAHWQLTPKEIETVSNPLANMIAKSEALNTLAEHSDAIALVTACATIILPRAVITVSQMQERKKNDERTNRVKKSVKREPEPNQDGKGSSTNRNNDGNTPVSGATVGENEPFYGDALY